MTKLYRSRNDKKLAGICGGIGEHLNIDPTIVRLVWAIISVATALVPTAIVYILGWMIIPEGPFRDEPVKDEGPIVE